MSMLEVALHLSPILILVGKIGLTFALWGVACAAVRVLNAITDYFNSRE